MISHAELLEKYHYDPDTGHFWWRARNPKHPTKNKPVGHIRMWGYVEIGVRKGSKTKYYKAHRLAWFYVYGEWPSMHLDHINHDRADNRIDNLRLATRKQNQGNMKRGVRNKSGYKGASQCPKSGKWRSYVCKNGKNIALGTFDTPLQAHRAYMRAARELYGEFASAG